METFLFSVRRGWCVHFATAAALMLRAVDVPTCFVTGFRLDPQPGQNEISDKDGHAWCEAYVRESDGRRHWIIVDPLAVRNSEPVGSPLSCMAGFGLLILLAGGGFFWRVRSFPRAVNWEKELRADRLRPERERVVAAYDRVLSLLARLGHSPRKAETAREFLARRAPEPARAELTTLTTAFERVSYMGFVRLGPAMDEVDRAQRRILGLRLARATVSRHPEPQPGRERRLQNLAFQGGAGILPAMAQAGSLCHSGVLQEPHERDGSPGPGEPPG